MKKLVLVTGATGFIGSHLVEALVARGRRVRCLVERGSSWVYLKNLDVELVYGDLLDKESLKKAVKGVDTVYHLAAKVRPSKPIESLKGISNIYRRVNVMGMINLIESCFSSDIRKFIYFSSIAATGPGVGIREEDDPCPITEYGKSKLESEEFILNFSRTKGFPIIIIRPASTYGPRNLAMLLLFKFIKEGFFLTIGDGSSIIPLCYVSDLIEASLLTEERGQKGEIYFIVEKSYSFNEIAQTIAGVFKKKLFILSLPKSITYASAFLKDMCEDALRFRICPFSIDVNRGVIKSSFTNWSCVNLKAKKELGFIPKIDLREGIDSTIKWYKEKGLL